MNGAQGAHILVLGLKVHAPIAHSANCPPVSRSRHTPAVAFTGRSRCEAYTVRKQAMRVQLRNRRVAMPTPLAERKAISGQPLMRGCSPGSPESLAQGMFSQRLPVNPGELPVSSRKGCGSPVEKRTRSEEHTSELQ